MLSRVLVGAEGFEPPTLPTCQSGCPEPAEQSISILFRLFQFFTCLSLAAAADFVSKASQYLTTQSLAFAVNPLWSERCFLSRSSTLVQVCPT